MKSSLPVSCMLQFAGGERNSKMKGQHFASVTLVMAHR